LALLVHSQALAFFGPEIPVLRLGTFLPVVSLMGVLPITVAHLGTARAACAFFFSDCPPEAGLLVHTLVSAVTSMLANGPFGWLFVPKAYGDLLLRNRRG